MTEATVTRALVELKTLEKRINKTISECNVLKVRSRGDKWDVNEFSRDAQSNFQSAIDLISRRDSIKARIMESNAVTKVKIGNREYTVAEVIDRKRNLVYRKTLLEQLRKQRQENQALFERKQQEMKGRLDRLIEIEFGKDVKSNADQVSNITKQYFESNKIELVDPINVQTKIKVLEDEIMEFEKEADLVLSESNAVTKISI